MRRQLTWIAASVLIASSVAAGPANLLMLAKSPVAASNKGSTQPINYGLVGGWFNPATPGQGFLIDIIPDSQFIFVPWFTFDTINPQTGGIIAGAEQRWFTAQGNYSGNRAELTIFASLEGIFDTPTDVNTFPIGTMVIEFSSCTNGVLTYDFPDIGLAGTIPISKLLADEICTRINNGEISAKAAAGAERASPTHPEGTSQNINYGLVGGWFNTATPGQGFMFDFFLDSNIMFAAWFTFDAAASTGSADQLRWFTAQGTYSGSSATLDLFQTRNGVFDDPTEATTASVGSMTVAFNTCSTGTVSYTIPGAGLSNSFGISKLLGDEICTRINNGEINLGDGNTSGGASINGALTYERVPFGPGNAGLDYCNIRQEPARDILIQAISAADGTTVLTSGATDANGRYSLDLPSNQNVFLRVNSAMIRTGQPSWDFRVVDNTRNKAIYALDTNPFASGTAASTLNLNIPSGFTGNCNAVGNMAYGGQRAAGPFAILDGVYQSYQKVLEVDPTRDFTPLLINWSVNNVPAGGDLASGMIGTSFFDGTELYILGADGADTDEYDDHIVIHEWGHYFEGTLSRSDSIGGPHGTGDVLDPRLAFGEGFGNAISGIVTDDPVYKDSMAAGNQTLGLAFNLEDNNNPNAGWFSEGSVQSILYDLYDATNETGDNVTLGFGPIYQVLRNEQRTTAVFTTIFSFVNALKANNPNQSGAIDNILAGQNITPVADAFGSTETNAAGSNDVLPVYSQAATDGSITRVCSIDTFGPQNKLSNRRFVDFAVQQAGNFTISVAPVSGASGDAAFLLFRNGTQLASVDQFNPGGTETLTGDLDAGTYILDVFEFTNVAGQGAGRNCFDVAIVRN